MAKCVFCGEKAQPAQKVYGLGDVSFKACPDCYNKYADKDWKTIYEAVISAGYYGDTYSLQDRLREEEAKEKEKIEQIKDNVRSFEEWMSGRECGVCPKCGRPMLKLDPVDLLYYTGGLPTMNISSFNASTVLMDMHVCAGCGYTEFYSTEVKKRFDAYLKNKEMLEEALKEEEE